MIKWIDEKPFFAILAEGSDIDGSSGGANKSRGVTLSPQSGDAVVLLAVL